MGLQQHQSRDDQQHRPVGHQLQKADVVQPLEGPPGQGALAPFLFLLRVPLGQAGGEKQNDRHLGNLRGLKGGPRHHKHPHPPLGAHRGAPIAKGKHKDQRRHRPHQHGDRQPAQGLVIDLGCKVHNQHPRPGAHRLMLDIAQGRVFQVVGGGVGGGEHHYQADPQQQHGQHQKGQVHGPPGQLFLHGKITFCLAGQRGPSFFLTSDTGSLPPEKPGRTRSGCRRRRRRKALPRSSRPFPGGGAGAPSGKSASRRSL